MELRALLPLPAPPLPPALSERFLSWVSGSAAGEGNKPGERARSGGTGTGAALGASPPCVQLGPAGPLCPPPSLSSHRPHLSAPKSLLSPELGSPWSIHGWASACRSAWDRAHLSVPEHPTSLDPFKQRCWVRPEGFGLLGIPPGSHTPVPAGCWDGGCILKHWGIAIRGERRI